MPLDRRRIGRLDLVEQGSCLGDDHFLGDPAGHQLGHQGVQATAQLGPPTGHVGVALGQQPTHRDVIRRSHQRQRRRVQRGHGDRAGIVRIGLRRLPGAQHAHPCRQRRRHVDHPLAGGDELLGEQIAHPAGRLHRPRPRPDTVSPRQQLGHLSAAGAHGELPQFTLPPVEHRRRVRPLVRVDSDHHVHRLGPPLQRLGTVASTPDSKDWRVPLVSHTTARPRQDDTSFVSQTMIGRHSESDPAGASRRYENPAAPTNETIRHCGDQAWRLAVSAPGDGLVEWAQRRRRSGAR